MTFSLTGTFSKYVTKNTKIHHFCAPWTSQGPQEAQQKYEEHPGKVPRRFAESPFFCENYYDIPEYHVFLTALYQQNSPAVRCSLRPACLPKCPTLDTLLKKQQLFLPDRARVTGPLLISADRSVLHQLVRQLTNPCSTNSAVSGS